MHPRRLTPVTALCLALAAPSIAAAQGGGQLQAFGGYTFGEVTPASTFGGAVAIPLVQNVHIVGEAGQLTNVLPSLLGTALAFTPVDVRLQTWYGEGGVRIIGGGRTSGARPYGEATFGMARMSTRVGGFGARPDIFTNAALSFLDTTKPMYGFGTGIVLQGGPVVVDLGYRYKRIAMGDALQSFVTFGDFGVSQVRVGLGFRF
jgi:hypothetical protein